MGKINNISNNILTKFVTRRNNNLLDEKKINHVWDWKVKIERKANSGAKVLKDEDRKTVLE